MGLGELNDDSLHDKPNVGYATYAYGLNNTFTGYVGAQYTDMDFYAGLLGLAMNTRIGAFALDVTGSYADIDGLDTLKGQSYRLTYSKMLEATNTSLNVAAYRFSTEDYLSLNDAASLQDSIHHEEYGNRSYDSNAELYADYQRTKNQIQVSLNQPLNVNGDEYGSLYISGTGRITGMTLAPLPTTAWVTTIVLLTVAIAFLCNARTTKQGKRMTAFI